MEHTHAHPIPYARAVRIVAGVIAVVIIGRHLTTNVPSPITLHELLVVRGIAVAVALGVALLCPARPSMARLRVLAFALGVDVVFVTIAVATLLPLEVWEESVSLVGMLF